MQALAAVADGATGLAGYWKVLGPFEPTHYVWSRGLALLCNHNGGTRFVKRQRGGRRTRPLDPARYGPISDGDLVWTRQTTLPQFVAEILPNIRRPFALVTGDEDWPIPSAFPGARSLLESELLVRWFTQNADGTDTTGKISPIPIGLDFHSISNGRKWGHWPATPAEQESELVSVIARAPPNRLREPKVHADFHFNSHTGYGEGRGAVLRALHDRPHMVFQDRLCPRSDLWETKTRYAFVLSPPGIGLDCHRTWESLALGNIVIVRRSPIDALFAGLPVVIVDDWEEVTESSLARWHLEHAEAFARPEVQARLTNRYWLDEMRAAVARDMGSTPSSEGSAHRPIQ
jgi:hypothetical protein